MCELDRLGQFRMMVMPSPGPGSAPSRPVPWSHMQMIALPPLIERFTSKSSQPKMTDGARDRLRHGELHVTDCVASHLRLSAPVTHARASLRDAGRLARKTHVQVVQRQLLRVRHHG
jgi:hypothetical protein